MSNLSIRDTISGSVSIGEGSTKGIINGSVSIGEGSTKGIINGSVSIGKGDKGEQGPVGPQGPIGDNNVCVGLSPTSEAEIWFDTTDGDNTKEVATKEYIDSEIAKIDSSNFATKTELSNKVDKVNGKSLISDSEIERLCTLKNYDDTDIKNTLNSKANKTELHSHSNKSVLDNISSAKVTEWNNKSNFSGNYNDLTNKPTIPTKLSQLSNDSKFVNEDYVDTRIDEVIEQIPEVNMANYYNKGEIEFKLGNKSDKAHTHDEYADEEKIQGILGGMVEEYSDEEISVKFPTIIDDLKEIKEQYSDISNNAIPNIREHLESITNDLSSYATKTQVNAFDTLTLGINENDGLMYIYKQGVPMGLGIELGVKGDIIGYIDSDNNIILSGTLANDTYKLKYEMENGSKIDVGEINLSNKPAYTNQIPLSVASDGTPFNGGQGWKTGYRISPSGGGEDVLDGSECTGFIPVTNESTIRIKGIGLPSNAGDRNFAVVGYNKSFKKLSGNGVLLGSIRDTTDKNGVTTFKAFSNFAHLSTTELAYIRLSSSNIDENSILTVDEEITV